MPNTCLCQFVQVEQIPSPNRTGKSMISQRVSVTWLSKQNVREGIAWTYECRCSECVWASECV